MWGMYSGVKVNEKHDGGNEKILESSDDPFLTPYRPLRGLKFYFLYMTLYLPLKLCSGKLPGVAGYFASNIYTSKTPQNSRNLCVLYNIC